MVEIKNENLNMDEAKTAGAAREAGADARSADAGAGLERRDGAPEGAGAAGAAAAERQQCAPSGPAANAAGGSALLMQLSHDIRTGASSIIGCAGQIKKQSTNPERVEHYADKIAQTGEKLIETVSNIIRLMNIRSGNLVMEYEKAEIEDMLIELEYKWSADLKKRGMLLITNHERIEHRVIQANVGILTESIDSIFRFISDMAFDGTTVRFIMREEKCDKFDSSIFHFVTIVPDLFVDPDRLNNMFNAYSGGMYEETSLPMIIARELTEISGGTVMLTSNEVDGTMADVTIPLKIATAFRGFRPIIRDTTRSQAELAGRRVLIVEDNDLNREIMVDIAVDLHMIFEEASDGIEAVNMVIGNPEGYYNYILMDIAMPNMDGLEASRNIRKMHKYDGTPIIAITANASAGDKAAAFEAGMIGYLTKPISLEKLANVMLMTDDTYGTNRL